MKIKFFFFIGLVVLAIGVSGDSLLTSSPDPLSSEQWALINSGYPVREDITDIKSKLRPGLPGFDIGFKQAQALLQKLVKSTVVVAVLDTGVDFEHEDLKENIFLNERECVDGKTPLGEASEDRDGNGYKGDCAGINLTTVKPAEKNRPYDDVGHGTHVAGIISAVSNNGLGVRGLSQHIKILPIKIISKDERRQKVLYTDRVAEAILYAVSRGAQVINLSIGWPVMLDTLRVREAIREAYRKGVFIVAAAGNNSHSMPTYPCAYREVICVGATQNDGSVTNFTNYGAHVDILAPGEHILSTYPTTAVPNNFSVRGYEIKSGSSQSAPLVSATLALLRNAYPGASVEQILARLLSTTNHVKGDINFGQGQVRLDRALADLTGPSLNYVSNYIRFLFKEQLVLELNENKQFKLPLTFQNLSNADQSVKINIESKSQGVLFQQKQIIVKIAAWQTATVSFDGSVDNLIADRKLRFDLSFNNGQKKSAQIVLAQRLNVSPRLEKLTIENSEDLSQLSMMSLTNVKGENAGEYFATFKRVDKLLQLSLWQRSNQRLRKIGNLNLADMSTPVGVFVDDANNDGVLDLILMGLKSSGSTSKFIIYYMSLALKPLWAEYPYIELADETPMFNFAKFGDIRSTRWLHRPALGLSSSILTPSIIEEGYKPLLDQSLTERREKKSATGKHAYYLEPFLNDKWAFRTRIIDNYNWVENIRQELGLYFYEKVEPLTELSDGTYLFLAGQLAEAKPLEVQLDLKFSWKVLTWPQNYLGYNFVPSFTLDKKSPHSVATEALFGFITPNSAQVIFINKENRNQIIGDYVLVIPDESENILRPLLISREQSQVKIILEAGQKLFGFIFTDSGVGSAGDESKYSTELVRTTYFDQVFSQMNIPIQFNLSKSALYVDDSQMTVNSIYIQHIAAARGFFAPINNSFVLDSNCRRLNPAKWRGESNFRINLLCRVDAKMELHTYLLQ